MPPSYFSLTTRAEQLTDAALLETLLQRIEAAGSESTAEAWLGLTTSDALTITTRKAIGSSPIGESARLHIACVDTKGALAKVAAQLAMTGLTMLEL
eukprot:55124-Prymnesium_polylepis.1